MLEAITHFVIGGMAALEGRDEESAVLLLEQMNAAGQIAQGTCGRMKHEHRSPRNRGDTGYRYTADAKVV